MKPSTLAVCVSLFLQPAALYAEQTFPDLAQTIPYFEQRLHSTRWQVRYSLLGELTGTDPQTKRVLEILANDENPRIANQALSGYVHSFVEIDKTVFTPEVYVRNELSQLVLPEDHSYRPLVDYCLGRGKYPGIEGTINLCSAPGLAVLDPADLRDPQIVRSLTVVGILGEPQDAEALYPFLESDNDYIALNAAIAVIRLGEKEKGNQTLLRLIDQDPVEHLCYMTKALRILKQTDLPKFDAAVLDVLAKVEQTQAIQPNWLNSFLLLAAEVKSDVWTK